MTQDGTNRTSSLAGTIGALALLMGITFPGEAAAQTACGDTTCPKGYSCEDVPAACPAIACAPGTECEPCEDTVLACVAEQCSSDSDCDVDMVCLAQTDMECSGEAPACEPGTDCDAPAPSGCTTIEHSQCVPRWSLPCQTAANCGDGFECTEREECSCSGSGSGGSAGAGAGRPATPTPGATPTPAPPAASGGASSSGSADPKPSTPAEPALPPPHPGEVPEDPGAAPEPQAPVPPDSCVCRPSGTSACQVIVRACEADSDCPARWTCQQNPEGVCWSGPDGSSGCEPGDPPMLCMPPYQNLGGYPTRGDVDSGPGTGTPATGGGVTPPTPTPPGSNEPGTPSTGNPSGPTPEPSVDAEEGDVELADADSRGGCTVTSAPASGRTNGALFAVAAALAFAVRRRIQRRARA